MAFTGLHIFCSFVGADSDKISLPRKPEWSDTFSTSGTTGAMAPGSRIDEDAVITVRAVGGAWWIAFGSSPADPALATTTRVYVADGDVMSFVVSPGDKVRGVLA